MPTLSGKAEGKTSVGDIELAVGSTGVETSRARRRRVSRELGRARRLRREAVRASEGNGASLEGRPAVGALRRTEEAGEPTQGTPQRKGGAGMRNRSEERWQRHRAHKLSQRNSNG
jgi:hypothetical protein